MFAKSGKSILLILLLMMSSFSFSLFGDDKWLKGEDTPCSVNPYKLGANDIFFDKMYLKFCNEHFGISLNLKAQSNQFSIRYEKAVEGDGNLITFTRPFFIMNDKKYYYSIESDLDRIARNLGFPNAEPGEGMTVFSNAVVKKGLIRTVTEMFDTYHLSKNGNNDGFKKSARFIERITCKMKSYKELVSDLEKKKEKEKEENEAKLALKKEIDEMKKWEQTTAQPLPLITTTHEVSLRSVVNAEMIPVKEEKKDVVSIPIKDIEAKKVSAPLKVINTKSAEAIEIQGKIRELLKKHNAKLHESYIQDYFYNVHQLEFLELFFTHKESFLDHNNIHRNIYEVIQDIRKIDNKFQVAVAKLATQKGKNINIETLLHYDTEEKCKSYKRILDHGVL